MTDKRIEFIYLNEDDMIKAGVRDMKQCLRAIEDMFVAFNNGDYRMGGEGANDHGSRVSFPKSSPIADMPLSAPDYRFGVMPAYLGGRFHMFGVKSYGSHHTNAEKGLPRSILMMSLLDVDTGAPIAYMSANILSAMRTGAVAGLGAKYLSADAPKTVAIIGPGVMSTHALKAMMEVQDTIESIRVVGLDVPSSEFFINKAKEAFSGLKQGVVCNTIQEACSDADIVFFGTSNAANYEDNPRIEKSWLKPGATVISISALQAPMELLADPDVTLVADNYKMYEDWGRGNAFPTQRTVSTLLGMGFYDAVSSGNIEKSSIINIGEIISGEKKARKDNEQIIVYAIGGMPVEDVAWAYDCYQKAKELEIGTKLLLWDAPAL